mgnify:CR=1 FL=1
MGSGFSKMKKQAKLLQEQMEKMQEDLQNIEVKGIAGNGLVEITMTGEKIAKNISINPDCIDPEDAEGLQDLIMAAFNDASKKIDEQSPTSNLGNMGLGNLPFNF